MTDHEHNRSKIEHILDMAELDGLEIVDLAGEDDFDDELRLTIVMRPTT